MMEDGRQRDFILEGGMGNEKKRSREAVRLGNSKSKIRKIQPEVLTIQTILTFLTIKTI